MVAGPGNLRIYWFRVRVPCGNKDRRSEFIYQSRPGIRSLNGIQLRKSMELVVYMEVQTTGARGINGME